MRGFSWQPLLAFGVVVGCCASVWAAPPVTPLPQTPPSSDSAVPPPPPPASFDDARFSLSLHDVALPEMLRQVSAATSLQFRYAAPPDVMISASFRNAPLFPSLEKTLRPEGFTLLRDGHDAWLLRAHPRPATALNIVPPAHPTPANPTPATSAAPQIKPTVLPSPAPAALSDSVSVPFDGWDMRVESQTREQTPNRDKHLALEADAREFPGVTVLIPQEKALSRKDTVVRYTLFLRHVPERLRLALDTPRAASLKVNGATLRRAWSGLAEFELSGALRPGLNSIEVRWSGVAPDVTPDAAGEGENKTEASKREESKMDDGTERPLLRYEWLSGNEPPPANTATLPLPGGFRLLLGDSEWRK